MTQRQSENNIYVTVIGQESYNHDIVTKVVKEVDKIIRIDPACVILDWRATIISKVEEAENPAAKIIDYKCQINSALKVRTGHGSSRGA